MSLNVRGPACGATLLAALASTSCKHAAPQPPPLASEPSAEVASRTAPRRGERYCEVLLGVVADGSLRLDVYNSFGMGDCPDAAWRGLDASRIEAQLHVDRAILNGPRVWLVDHMEGSSFADPTPRAFGSIGMRLGARLSMPLSEARSEREPYRAHEVHRNTVYRFDAGEPVFELVAPDGSVYVMQSFSQEKAPLSESDLAGLASRLHLPAGWRYRERVLDAELTLRTSGGVAFVLQDDLNDTYQRERGGG